MQHQQAAALNSGVHGACNTVSALHAHLPELVFQGTDVRQADTLWSKVFKQLGDVQEASTHIGRERLQFGLCQRV